MSKLCKGASVVCMIEILALVALLILAVSSPITAVAYAAGSASPCPCSAETAAAVMHSVNNLLTGSLRFPFWVGVVLVGLLLPLGVEMSLILREVESPPRGVTALLAVMVLTGGIILRAVIVSGGQF